MISMLQGFEVGDLSLERRTPDGNQNVVVTTKMLVGMNGVTIDTGCEL
jgi:hypothetical protein